MVGRYGREKGGHRRILASNGTVDDMHARAPETAVGMDQDLRSSARGHPPKRHPWAIGIGWP